ncbi:MAG: sulfite exporter TauE/SafE family protein [Nitrospiraceae bacterium]|nr:sulfite exporter TauE/SafE family protein [Nitrospiraceae bacterium]
METGYVFAFTTGLAGGFGHCIGMCGPLAASFSVQGKRSPPSVVIGRQLLYHAGRVTTYALIGAVMGYAGSFVNVAGSLMGVQNSVMILAGVLMVAMGLGIAGLIGGTAWIERHNAGVLGAARRVIAHPSGLRNFPLGLLMGLLPCGLSYTSFIAAAGTGSPVSGMMLMLAFGCGTVPALAAFGAAAGYVGSRLRGRVQQAGGLLVLAMGLYYIVKGIRLYAEM